MAILGLFAASAVYRFGSVSHALAYARGERLIVDERMRSLGDVPAGSRQTLPFAITNLTAKPVRLIGSRASCSCTVIGDVPLTIGPRETRSVPVMIAVDDHDGSALSGTVVLFTDDPTDRELKLAFSGRAVAPWPAR